MREVKKALRKELIRRRREMPPELKAAADADLFERLRPLAAEAGAVFTYVSTELECDTRRLIGFCLSEGIPTAVPVSGDEELEFYRIGAVSELSAGRFGILEPASRSNRALADKNTLCVVPALTADGNGFRLGYGRGYYDRFLKDFPGKSVIICYGAFRGDVPREAHDIAADMTLFDKISG